MRSWSHRSVVSSPVYVAGFESGKALGIVAIFFMETHCPWPLQSYKQPKRWQASPEKPLTHLHVPVALLHVPLPLHSAGAWAVLLSDATSAQAGPLGQVLPEQSWSL